MHAATVITRRYVACPACHEGQTCLEQVFEHQPTTFGTWYCDACGAGYRGEVRDGQVFVELCGDRRVDTSVLLRIPPQKSPIWLLVQGSRFEPEGDSPEEVREQERRFYEQSATPSSSLRAVAKVMLADETEPQGLLEFVQTLDGAARSEGEDRLPELVKAELQ